jgi:hypothetical protein
VVPPWSFDPSGRAAAGWGDRDVVDEVDVTEAQAVSVPTSA